VLRTDDTTSKTKKRRTEVRLEWDSVAVEINREATVATKVVRKGERDRGSRRQTPDLIDAEAADDVEAGTDRQFVRPVESIRAEALINVPDSTAFPQTIENTWVVGLLCCQEILRSQTIER
jgi:hypothetical protein